MRYLDEYRDSALVHRYAEAIRATVTRPWTLMEICGGQTHAIVRYGIDQLLPEGVELVHGPGCPVCVTPMGRIDQAIDLARKPGFTICSFGDMLRVPGSSTDLLRTRALGGDVRIVYSPLDAVNLAAKEPDRQFVFFAVGFETTAPANALAVRTAADRGLSNFTVLVAHVLVPPAIEAILGAPDNRIQGFLAAGHVCAVTGMADYERLAHQFRVPMVVTGFEPADILFGVLACVRQLEAGHAEAENAYARAVRSDGNRRALDLVEGVFEVADQAWRGLGVIPKSGYRLRHSYREFDATRRFGLETDSREPASECLAADVLRGMLKPDACPAFGSRCTPENPLGAPMVSNEGACAAYYRYRPMVEIPVQ
ncbi:MAG: hydrogenase formation protein HypD [Fimbriimonas sp.]|nr:hydrogenase formation protein HypD [Fimbriimonas sp.]